MLISPVIPIMSIYRLPHGQCSYSGHVINLPQDVMSFATSLPRLPSDLDIIIVRKECSNQSHRDFRVCKVVVTQALQWLIIHNKYYSANHVCIDQNALSQLPEDGNLPNLSSIALEGPTEDGQAHSLTDSNGPDDANFSQSFVLTTTQSMTEQDAVYHSVQQRQSSHSGLHLSCGLQLEELPSTSLPPRATFPVPSLHSSPLVLLTSQVNGRIRSRLVTTSSIS